ncbi:MAG: hypothetical protein OXC54_00925 [Rhodospirillaceae bacterium]|nr:hypothetical protein [Rhodospirillaceae bacterium]MCY4309872.1 hypothetical protein [Rhodospirillaceae bacterium]
MFKGLIGGLCGLCVMAGACWIAAVIYVNADGSRLAERYLQPLSGRGEVTYGAVEKSLFSQDLVIRDIKIRTADGRRVTIAEVLVRQYDWLSARNPTFADVTVTGLAANAATLGPQVEAQAARAGLKRIDADIHYAFEYDAEARWLRIETMRIAIKEIGTLTLEAAFAGFPKPDLSRAGLNKAVLTAKIARAQAVFTDKNLASRIVDVKAAAAGLSNDKAKAAFIRDLDKRQKAARNSLLKEMYGVFRLYIAKPGKITIAIQPDRPVRLASLVPAFFFSPGQIKRILNLRITTSSVQP